MNKDDFSEPCPVEAILRMGVLNRYESRPRLRECKRGFSHIHIRRKSSGCEVLEPKQECVRNEK